MSRSDSTANATAAPMPPGRTVLGRAVLGATTAVTVIALVSACSGGSSGASTKSSTPSSNGANGGVGRGSGAQQPPGTSGLIAAVSPGLLEVQNQSGQTSVMYTATTVFSQQKAVTEAAVKVGECVSAVDASALNAARSRAGGSSGAPATKPAIPSDAPTPTPGAPVSITASTVAISQPVNGSCTAAGRGGFNGARPSGARPSDAPTGSGSRTGTRGGFGGGGFAGFVTGTVSAATAGTISVQAANRQSGTTVTDTVTLTGATQYTETVAATSAAAKVGQCANAVGAADSSGAVAATRIDITAPVNGACTGGFGRLRGGSPQSGAPTSG